MIRSSLGQNGDCVRVEDASLRWTLTGGRLIAAADKLAWDFARFVNRPLVLYMEKSDRYYACLGSCFLHSISFCPVDIGNPIKRLLEIAGQLENSLIVTDDKLVEEELRKRGAACFLISNILGVPESQPYLDKPDHGVARYFIATSGSTGVPKLVEIPHDRTVAFIKWAIQFYQINDECRWAQFSSIGFDLSLVDFLAVLCGGGTLVSLSSNVDRLRPAKTVARMKITHWHSVPSMIPYFIQEKSIAGEQESCRVFSFCGEPFLKSYAELLAKRYPFARIINTYGPTEGTLFCSYFEFHLDDRSISEPTLPIGQPIPSWNFVLLPENEFRRLVIVSDNIANGYVGRKSELFSTVKLFDKEMRAYDTGDYFLFSGAHLHFSHRLDGMVKVSGTRIDLGEIESAASRVGLTNPVAIAKNNSIILAAEGEARPFVEVSAELAEFLPEIYLPKKVVFFEHLPRTLNGKLDRRDILNKIEADE